MIPALLLALLAVAVLGPAVVAVLARPQRGVLLLAALLPFDGLLLLVPHDAVVEGWKEGVVGVVLLATFVAPATARGEPGRALPQWLLPVAGLVAVSALSALLVGGTQGVQGMKIGFFYLLLFWALWRCPFSSVERDRLVSVLMATGLVTSVVGLAQQFVGGEVLIQLGYDYESTVRTTGGLLRSFSTFVQPFPFGLYVVLVLLVALPVALQAPRRPRNLAFLVASPVLLAGLLSSTVRSALLGLAVGLVFLAVHRYRVLVHLLPPALLGLAFVPATAIAAITSSDSLEDRATGWNAMLDVMVSSPFGVGIGSTGSAAERTDELGASPGVLFSPRWASGYQPDNYYVKTLLELGPVGLWLVVLMLLAVFLAATRTSRLTSGADAALAAGIAASVVAAAAAAVFSTYFEIFPLDVYFWMLAGVLATLPGLPAAASDEPAPRPVSR